MQRWDAVVISWDSVVLRVHSKLRKTRYTKRQENMLCKSQQGGDMGNTRRLALIVLFTGFMVVIGVIGTLGFTPTTHAQQPPVFVTNTPIAPDPLNIQAPQLASDRYALRLWQENDLIDVLVAQLNRLIAGEPISPRAIQMTQYELERRFPGAPHNMGQRERVLTLMFQAMNNELDLRSIARPYIVHQINQIGISAGTSTVLGNLSISTRAINLDGVEPIDMVVEVSYTMGDGEMSQTVYQDHLLLQGTEDGFVLPDLPADLRAAPFRDIQSVDVWQVADLNNDGRDELALSVDRGDLNKELLIYGWRADAVINLIEPNQHIYYGDQLAINGNPSVLTTNFFQLESSRWQCVSSTEFLWTWTSNFFRPNETLNINFTDANTVGCGLYRAEPIFAQPAGDAIQTVSVILAQGMGIDEAGWDRGNIALAMLFVLDGDAEGAGLQVDLMEPLTNDNPWLANQVEAFNTALESEQVIPVEVCTALLLADDDGACDIDQVLAQLFTENPILRADDLVPQLEALDLPVLEVVEVSQIGLANRQVVNFNLHGASWWAFAPTDPEQYNPEIANAPVGFGEAVFPIGLIQPTQIAYDALFVHNNPSEVLTVLDNLMRANPDVPFSLEAQYLQALSYDLQADRRNAYQAYYDLWSENPTSQWGILAAVHLEAR